MKNRKYCSKELNLLQKLKHENDKLKKEISKLRKQYGKVDESRFEHYRDILTRYDQKIDKENELEQLKKKWGCFDCGRGILQLKKLSIGSTIEYYRKCNTCEKRTKLQPWSKDVTGFE